MMESGDVQQVPAEPLLYEFRNDLPPRATVGCGETFVVESEDALSGQIRQPGDCRDKTTVPKSNPVVGPIVVEGAEPGDTLRVEIISIEPRDGQCATYVGHPQRLTQWLGEHPPGGAHVCPIRDGQILWSNEGMDRQGASLAIPYQPMLGCLGVAPAWGVPTTLPAGDYGGNLDLREVEPGATVHLPVEVPGAMLYLGDAHAAMGHGELSATGLEMAARTTVRVEIERQTRLDHVRIETADAQWAAVAVGLPMEQSVAHAYARLILWMESELGWNRWDAYDLLTHVGEISIGFYGLGAVAAKAPLSMLQAAQ